MAQQWQQMASWTHVVWQQSGHNNTVTGSGEMQHKPGLLSDMSDNKSLPLQQYSLCPVLIAWLIAADTLGTSS